MRNDEEQPVDDVLGATLRAADVLLRVVAQTVIAVEHVVTGPQLRVLVMILRDGPTTPSAVATELDVHASNASRVCSRLERAGLIVRLPAAEDRRLRRFVLAPAGNKLVSVVMAERRRSIGRILDRLSESESGRLRAALDTFARAAEGDVDHDGGLTLTTTGVSLLNESPRSQKPKK